jgi:hypothetical protein
MQMIGGSKPMVLHVARIFGVKFALAMCVQFQVIKKSIPCMVAMAICKASNSTRLGS